MVFFDFHHHDRSKKHGIYNLKYGETPPENLFSAGIHPNLILDNFEKYSLWLNEISLNPNCAAIGECGLDGLISVDEKLQEEVFEQQIFLANKIGIPLVVHCVRRFSRLIYFKKKAKVPMIVHGFSNRKTIAEELLKHKIYLSFGESLLHKIHLQELIKTHSSDFFFLETDSKNFEIKNLYEKVAEIKDINLEELTKKITRNLKNLKII
jgi:TatD DNase family protein